MAAKHPQTILKMCNPEYNLGKNPSVRDKYHAGRGHIMDFLKQNFWLNEPAKPSLFIYRQDYNGHTQTGVMGCVSMQDYAQKKILKHEEVLVSRAKMMT
jgi:uncharacterized protein (DUF1015 family)